MARPRQKNRIIVSGNIIYLILEDKKGNEIAKAIIDKEDYSKVLAVGRKFYMKRNKNKSGQYVINCDEKLHHTILETKNLIDHINGNPLDNKKRNLRICSKSQNQYNSKIRVDNTSGFKGVCWSKCYKKWRVYIYKNKHQILLGYFNNKIEAAKAYNEAAKKYHGEFARLNRISQRGDIL